MRINVNVKEGKPYPLGATWDGAGVNFALYSKHAESVYLCLFDSSDSSCETLCIPVRNRTHYIWHCYVEGILPGVLYGYRVYGPYQPSEGHRFNPSKVLLDPYALAIGRDLIWSRRHFGYEYPYSFDTINSMDNADTCLLGAVVDPSFSWGNDKQLKIPWKDTIIYEVHLKGFTRLNSLVPEEIRGTYLAFTVEPVIQYLKDLGITTIEFLPVQHSITEYHLHKQNQSNFWGYNPIAFFAPNPRYAYGKGINDAIREFKTMVKVLHQAGFEVILDVVYNHTAEGDHTGPTLSFRGIDNLSYYRVYQERKDLYLDFTGCGNTLNHQNHYVLQLIMDSLRYWITEMHVDGFRFDLASALARELYDVDRLNSFFAIVQQDPIISQVKLIAEPWDLGKGGYQVGNFPPGWSEWNGKYRDTVRKVINEKQKNLSDFATRISGSSDLYKKDDRKTFSSINFITCHDGFTLRDLVSYNHKHNEENGWNNLDGADENFSYNHGIEGETKDIQIQLLRLKKQKLFLTTLLISLGVPMILGGDELNRTQKGNNNAYCQDNSISYVHWEWDEFSRELWFFTRYLILLRKENEVFRREHFFKGEEKKVMEVKDVYWLRPDGKEMQTEDWNTQLCIGMLLPSEFGERFDFYSALKGDTFLIIFNFTRQEIKFKIPEIIDTRWKIVLNTHKHLFVSFRDSDKDKIEEIEKVLQSMIIQKEDLNQKFYEYLQLFMSDGELYLPGEEVIIPDFCILILKAEKGWQEAHVKRNYRFQLLEQLISELGIYKTFFDLTGKEYRLSNQQLYRMLRALHFPVKDLSSIEIVYENYKNEKWFQGVLPAQTFFVDENIVFNLHIPETMKNFTLQIRNQKGEVVLERTIEKFKTLKSHNIHFSRFKKLKMIFTKIDFNIQLPMGYYMIDILHNQKEIYSKGKLIIAPRTAYSNEQTYTGVWIQLYALQSTSNLGIGDFGDLKKLALLLKQYGYNLIGLSPIHYLPLNMSSMNSPYYPASRLMIHPIYIDIFSLEEFKVSYKAKQVWKAYIPEIEKLKKQSVIQYEKVYQIKKEILYEVYKELISNPQFTEKRERFLAFKQDNELLFYHSFYETVLEVFGTISPPPEIYKAKSKIQNRFAKEHQDKIDFYSYLFFIAEEQFLNIKEELLKEGIYLYLDLALGCAPGHAEAIYYENTYPYLISRQGRAGSPPDSFSPSGQDWGLSVMNPYILKKFGYEPFILLLKKNLKDQTFLRIDHIMWLYRLFWIVKEGGESTATYIRYPDRDLFSILCLESQINRSIIIGEDLGTVPREIRQILKEKHILSWKVMYFEKDDQGFKDPKEYPLYSVVTVNTHDLPTLAGFWTGKDIEERLQIGMITQEQAEEMFQQRSRERVQIIELLNRKGYLKDLDQSLTEESIYDPLIASMIYQVLAEAPSKILLVSLHDLLGEVDQPNMPGTTTEYPNWSLRYSVPIEEFDQNPYFTSITNALKERLQYG